MKLRVAAASVLVLALNARGLVAERPLYRLYRSPEPIYAPPPKYPEQARRACIQGIVRLEAIVSADGTISELRFISGHPLLVNAAMDAVKHWLYPPIKSGRPIDRAFAIKVPFRLSGRRGPRGCIPVRIGHQLRYPRA